jgi:hypothetical protein
MPDKDATADAADNAVTPITQQHGKAIPATGRVGHPPAPSTASSPASSPGGKNAASKRVAGRAGGVGRMLGAEADAD